VCTRSNCRAAIVRFSVHDVNGRTHVALCRVHVVMLCVHIVRMHCACTQNEMQCHFRKPCALDCQVLSRFPAMYQPTTWSLLSAESRW
jgi:hypothetical protein